MSETPTRAWCLTHGAEMETPVSCTVDLRFGLGPSACRPTITARERAMAEALDHLGRAVRVSDFGLCAQIGFVWEQNRERLLSETTTWQAQGLPEPSIRPRPSGTGDLNE